MIYGKNSDNNDVSSINNNKHIEEKILDSAKEEAIPHESKLSCQEKIYVIKSKKNEKFEVRNGKFFRFKLIILDKSEYNENLLKVDYNLFEIILPCLRSNLQNKKWI